MSISALWHVFATFYLSCKNKISMFKNNFHGLVLIFMFVLSLKKQSVGQK